jgi:hypothetical protein
MRGRGGRRAELRAMEEMARPRFYDRQGTEISLRRWGQLLADDRYRYIAVDELAGGLVIFTAWFGLDSERFQTAIVLTPGDILIGTVGSGSEQAAYRQHDHMVAIGRAVARNAEKLSADAIAAEVQRCQDRADSDSDDNRRLLAQNRRSDS